MYMEMGMSEVIKTLKGTEVYPLVNICDAQNLLLCLNSLEDYFLVKWNSTAQLHSVKLISYPWN